MVNKYTEVYKSNQAIKKCKQWERWDIHDNHNLPPANTYTNCYWCGTKLWDLKE